MARESASIQSVWHSMSANGGKTSRAPRRGGGKEASDIRESKAIHLRISEVQVDVDVDIRALAARRSSATGGATNWNEVPPNRGGR